MKFFLTTAFLASLALGQENHASDTDVEDFAYWRDLLDTASMSMPPTLMPSKSPVAKPTNAPVAPTVAPVAPTVAPVAPTIAPVAPTVAPVAPTVAPVAPTDAPAVPATLAPTVSPTPCKSISEVLSTTPEFSTLSMLIDALGISDLLDGGTLTLFAPVNTAFDAVPAELLDAAQADVDLLDFVVFGHVVTRQQILVKDLACEGGPISSLTMANGEEATITCDTATDTSGIPTIETFIQDNGDVPGRIVGPDGLTCRGVIHAIDEVIIPEIPATGAPTIVPVTPTDAPVTPTDAPAAPLPKPETDAPVTPTDAPTNPPTNPPTDAPTDAPTLAPVAPTGAPVAPTLAPTPIPTAAPTNPPTAPPTASPTAGTPQIQAKLAQYALASGAEFEDTTSYQYKALKQVEAQVGVDSFTDAKLTQYYALYCIYFATNGVPNRITDADPRFVGIPFPNWLITTGWEETSLDPCGGGWYGVVCDDESRVSILDLFENLLTGAFPPEIKLLALDGPFATGAGNLFRLDLFRNEFLFNNLDSSWMSDLGSNMTTIIAEETAFSGAIPRLPENIVNFDVSFAYYTGGLIDSNFENLQKLTFIDLDGNAFNSTIPSVFGRLPNLEFLYLSDSFISGDMSYMQGMSSIREHWIDTNPGLKGPIFDFIGEITSLESWSMAFNSLTGTLPSTLGNLVNMKQMWLYANELTGVIPPELGNLASMRILELEGNSFVGTMPFEVCANTAFPTQIIEKLGADCDDPNFSCTCCTCCSVLECTNS
eukprot:CAMPEP_0172390282 /NCGR_PEP_ID=MMETSP1061-20121228/6944_1 /TAXON_ID=37318 /ORGANISM="Pseudo-nitzschia pungens, Strain cf. pungens" /LENGTH=765 /DNA_ID=CAMNT_0013120597 /DNA_START=45 /DNA_END=2342 /DNA_ORIENTATION=-